MRMAARAPFYAQARWKPAVETAWGLRGEQDESLPCPVTRGLTGLLSFVLYRGNACPQYGLSGRCFCPCIHIVV